MPTKLQFISIEKIPSSRADQYCMVTVNNSKVDDLRIICATIIDYTKPFLGFKIFKDS